MAKELNSVNSIGWPSSCRANGRKQASSREHANFKSRRLARAANTLSLVGIDCFAVNRRAISFVSTATNQAMPVSTAPRRVVG